MTGGQWQTFLRSKIKDVHMNAVCAEPEHMLVSEAAKNVKCMVVWHAQQNAVAG